MAHLGTGAARPGTNGRTAAGLLTRKHLLEDAKEWDRQGRDASLLYRGTRLAVARDWADTEGRGLLRGPLASAFLAADNELEERERQTARKRVNRLRRLAVTPALLLVASVTSGAIAVQQRQAAVHGRHTATSRELATKSTLLATAEPDASMLLAAEAFRQGRTTEARGALLSAQSQRLAGVLPDHRGSVRSLAFSPDGRLLATAAADRNVRLWDVSTRRRVAVLTRNKGAVTAVAFSPDGKLLDVGGRDATIALWAPDTDKRLARLTGHGKGVENGGVLVLAFGPDGRTLASGGDDRTVGLWDTREREALAVLEGHTNSVTTLAFAPSGAFVVSGGADGKVKLWDVARRRLRSDVDSDPAQVRSVVLSPDSRLIAVGNDTGDTEIWTVEDGQYVTEFTGHTLGAVTAAFSSNGSTLVSSGDDTIRLWNLEPGRGPGDAPHLRRGGTFRRPGPLAQAGAGRSPPHAVLLDKRRHTDRRSRPEAPLPGPARPMTCLRTVTGAAPPSRKRCNCGRGQ